MMIKIKEALILLFVSITLFYCGDKPKDGLAKIGPALVWTQNQDFISPETVKKHTWSGFSIKKNFFVAFNKNSKLVFWRKQPEKIQFFISYVLKGRSVPISINGKKCGALRPSAGAIPFKKQVNLKRGFNFIEFRKDKNTTLKIKYIKIGKKSSKRSSDLIAGESVTLFLSTGSGFLTMNGEGKLKVRKAEWVQGKKSVDESVFGSGRVKIDLHFDSLGFIDIACSSGRYNIVDYLFKKNPKKKESAKTRVKKSPNIFILVIDGCQQTHLGLYGYFRNTSPHIDEFAKDGVVFENAYANATFTGSSIATLFTGFFPQRHQLKILNNRLPNRFLLLPEFLKERGYQTSVYSEAGNITPSFGFGQGVDDMRKLYMINDNPRSWNRSPEKYISHSFDKWTDKNGLLFSYIHYRAPHFPLLPPPPYLDMFRPVKPKIDRNQRLIRRIAELRKTGHKFTKEEIQNLTDDYDSTIRHVDSLLGELIKILKKKGLYDNSLIIITSDHGEALYEHGELGHGHNVFNETSLIPLVVKFPLYMNLKGRVSTVVQLADVFPTIADLLGEKMDFDGKSLLQAIEEKTINDNTAISTTFQRLQSFGIRWRHWYYMVNLVDNSEKLFHLNVDPLNDCSADYPDMLTFFKGKFLAWLHRCDSLGEAGQSIDLKKLPDDIREDLKTLGYID